MVANEEIVGWLDVCSKDGSNVEEVGFGLYSFLIWWRKT
jgi:hypothetical protein